MSLHKKRKFIGSFVEDSHAIYSWLGPEQSHKMLELIEAFVIHNKCT